MRKLLIILILISILVASTASSVIIADEKKEKAGEKAEIKNYADTKFKKHLNYNTFTIIDYKVNGDLVVIDVVLDGKKVKWYTSKENFPLLRKIRK